MGKKGTIAALKFIQIVGGGKRTMSQDEFLQNLPWKGPSSARSSSRIPSTSSRSRQEVVGMTLWARGNPSQQCRQPLLSSGLDVQFPFPWHAPDYPPRFGSKRQPRIRRWHEREGLTDKSELCKAIRCSHRGVNTSIRRVNTNCACRNDIRPRVPGQARPQQPHDDQQTYKQTQVKHNLEHQLRTCISKSSFSAVCSIPARLRSWPMGRKA